MTSDVKRYSGREARQSVHSLTEFVLATDYDQLAAQLEKAQRNEKLADADSDDMQVEYRRIKKERDAEHAKVKVLREALEVAEKLWEHLVDIDGPWSEEQDTFVSLGLLKAVDMTKEDSPQQCDNCELGDCDVCYRTTGVFAAALAQTDSAPDGGGTRKAEDSIRHSVESLEPSVSGAVHKGEK